MEIGKRKVGPGHPCFIVGEIGQNHNGDVYTATRLIEMVAGCGVDAVKLQARLSREEFSREALARPYTGRNSFGRTYGQHREALDLTPEHFEHLKERHRYNRNPAELFTTVCAVGWIEWLEANDWCRFYKVASKDMANRRLIEALAATGKPLIISTGLAPDLAAITQTLDWAGGRANIALMHCVAQYPTPRDHLCLAEIETLRQEFGGVVGYSDHSAGVKAPVIAAIKYDADILEVHCTSNRALPGTDHAASLEEPGLLALVNWVREYEAITLGATGTILQDINASIL